MPVFNIDMPRYHVLLSDALAHKPPGAFSGCCLGYRRRRRAPRPSFCNACSLANPTRKHLCACTHMLPNTRTHVAHSLMICARHRILDPVPALQSHQDVGPGAWEAVRAGAAGVVGGDARRQSPARALAQVRQRRHEWAATHGRPRVPQGELLTAPPERPWLRGGDRVCVCAYVAMGGRSPTEP